MEPLNPVRKKSARQEFQKKRRPRYYDEEEDQGIFEQEEEEEEEDYYDPYERKLIYGRNHRSPVRRYLREETSFLHDVTIGPCRRVVRMSCNTISYIVSFFAICFFFGMVLKISYGIYSFFV